VTDWIDTFATIDTSALIGGGTLRTFYADGAAVFTALTMRGNASQSYDITITLTGPDLCVLLAHADAEASTHHSHRVRFCVLTRHATRARCAASATTSTPNPSRNP
jgi:hypothetical protein